MKKFLSVFLALVMVVAMLPIGMLTAYAYSYEDPYVIKLGEVKKDIIKEAEGESYYEFTPEKDGTYLFIVIP